MAEDSFSTGKSVDAGGLATISRTGQIVGDCATAAFLATLKTFAAEHPLPGWIVEFEYQASASTRAGDRVDYKLFARQLATPLLSAAGFAVSGSVASRAEPDELEPGRVLTVADFDLEVAGDPIALAATLRPVSEAIVRESLKFTSIEQRRIRWSLATIAPAGN